MSPPPRETLGEAPKGGYLVAEERQRAWRGDGIVLDRVRALLLHRKRSHVLWEGGKEEGGEWIWGGRGCRRGAGDVRRRAKAS